MPLTKVTSSLINTVSASQIVATGATAGQILTYNGSTSTWVASAAPDPITPSSPLAAKAWVNFDGDVGGTWPGGTSTVTRVVGSTTATVTTTTAHGLRTGHAVYAKTGVAAGHYVVTVVNATTFTFTTVATTALNAASITFNTSTVRSGYNVSSVTRNTTVDTDASGGDYTINFTNDMSDTNYVVISNAQVKDDANANIGYMCARTYDTKYVRIISNVGATVTDGYDVESVCVVIFGN